MTAGIGIELADVARRHETAAGVVRALDRVSLTVAPWESLAITG